MVLRKLSAKLMATVMAMGLLLATISCTTTHENSRDKSYWETRCYSAGVLILEYQGGRPLMWDTVWGIDNDVYVNADCITGRMHQVPAGKDEIEQRREE